MIRHSNILGLDIGSVSISLVEMTPDRKIRNTGYAFHHGQIRETLVSMLEKIDLTGICGIASTSSTPLVVHVNQQYDNRIAVMKACEFFHGPVQAILIVGGEKFGLIRFDDNGNYVNFKANTSCAAGTGSFLDQQAGRLGLNSTEELSEMAFSNTGTVPPIASRCAVFAKTDLVHAQQEGYTLPQICDGLCRGLSKNIADTLFAGEIFNGKMVMIGGVAKNRAVVRHLSSLIHQEIVVGDSFYGSVGAALSLLDELPEKDRMRFVSVSEVLVPRKSGKNWFYPPLRFQQSQYPDFRGIESFEYIPPDFRSQSNAKVEIDIYEDLGHACREVYLGMDIGSTSTKAILAGKDKTVLAGFYTRTAGKPVEAMKIIFAAIDHVRTQYAFDLRILGAGTTGSGRKFVGKIIRADLIMDEISAHARAAVEIDPEVDTIIEIGGQDSKFTTLQNGMVTFSIMNTVCAAGTGSFVEEQARKLGCPLTEYAKRTENRRSPMASDRCTVFMERDINHYLSEGYERDEVLGSVLHSIVENYLTKVAIEGNIGDTIFFQGATAKNRALVAAFEYRLKKPIHVSRYCHLTGALGTALTLIDQKITRSGFAGISLYKKDIPIHSEVCGICTNHCKLTIAEVDREKVAYGFLCGRDYEGSQYVDNNKSGFDLLKERKEEASFRKKTGFKPDSLTIGLPAGLYMAEDLPFWEVFFNQLSIRTKTSRKYRDAVRTGKQLAGAEFCAPLAALYGHVDYLIEQVDYVFLPFYLEKKTERRESRRQFCYYTQFSPSLIYTSVKPENRKKMLMPLENYLYSSFYDKVQLFRMLKTILPDNQGFFAVSNAYDKAVEFRNGYTQSLKRLYRVNVEPGEFHAVLLGRPYTVLSPAMNKRIPEIFNKLGVKTIYQDMLSYSPKEVEAIDCLLDEVHWNYAAKILEAACVTAQRKGAYPVLITSFKCTPDSFVMEYVKQIMESCEKPYLILQLDDHDSSVGYETRIEAAIRSFKNHYDSGASFRKENRTLPALIPSREKRLDGRTLLLPNWDRIALRFIVAAFQKEGIDARLLEENQTTIRKSLRHNTGQCIPLNIIAQECIDYVESHNLDPGNTVLWNVKSSMACNLAIFPHHIKNIFRKYGKGMEKMGVYAGEISFMDISVKLPVNIYFSYMFGGLFRKIGCRIRPYEKIKGETDRVLERNIDLLVDSFLGNRSREDALDEAITNFERIEQNRHPVNRPKVAIFGDLYVRDNEIMNQDLIHYIEENGGEVVVTPFSSYVKMIEKPYLQKWFREKLYFNVFSYKALIAAVKQLEKNYTKYFDRILTEPEPRYDDSPREILSEYGIREENSGESIENVLKVYYTKKHVPDISLFVQTSPAFCCPSMVTEAMAKEIEQKTGVPIVSITYDGTGGMKNDAIIPYLKYPRTGLGKKEERISRIKSSG
ncbi:MAG: CoA activase [Desulfobacteraceae bacterium]|nr:MAG: CoA activase [Desulfobacteraceae bacterium]